MMTIHEINTKNKTFSFLLQPRVVLIVWILTGIIFGIQGLITFRYNNYLIFKYSFPHLIHQLPLYVHYPLEYGDTSHYGPVFSLFIAPFYFLPDWLGLPLWDIVNAVILWYAIRLLPLQKQTRSFIGWLALPVLIASTLSEQFNPMAGAFILFSFLFIIKGKECWSAFFIILGTFIKLYGIAGLAFFFFTRKKKQFIGYLLLWTVILFFLPMLFSPPHYILQSYHQWLQALITKNSLNISLITSQDVSIMGLTRRIFLDSDMPDWPFLAAGILLFATVYIHKEKFFKLNFQLAILAIAVIAPVIFSTSSEDVTYIIAITGAGLWFIMSKNNTWRTIVFILLLIVSLVPLWTMLPVKTLHQHPFIYSIKAFPYTLIWLSMIYEIHSDKDECSPEYDKYSFSKASSEFLQN